MAKKQNILKLMLFAFRIKQDKQLTVFPFARVTVFLNLPLVILGCLSGNAVNLNFYCGLFLIYLNIILKSKMFAP